MKVEYNNLYTHFIFTTFLREALIQDAHRDRIEKYITGIETHTFEDEYDQQTIKPK
jgi:putative transposase